MDDKARILERVARTGKALAHPSRLAVLELLIQRPRTVGDLARIAGLQVTTLSAHLQILKDAGLVATQRRGTSIVYAAASSQVPELFDALTRLSQPGGAQAAGFVPADVPHVTREDLEDLQSSGRLAVIDVRPADEFEAGHIPGAVSVPLEDLAGHLPRLPRDTIVVAYCRGRTCVLGWKAVRLLRAQGLDARVLCDGIVEWQADHHLDTPGLAS